MTDAEINIDDFTNAEIDLVLQRFDATPRRLQRRVIAQNVLESALLIQSRAETKFQRETCDKLNRLSERLRTELAAKMDEVERLRTALNKIASWGEGKEVSGRFDSPYEARIAREALKPKDPSNVPS